jgi:hypothetical protein
MTPPDAPEDATALLRDIRDLQRELLAEYRRVGEEALALQRQAFETQQRAVAQQGRSVEMQAGYARLYRIVLLVALPLIGFILWLIVRLARPLLH